MRREPRLPLGKQFPDDDRGISVGARPLQGSNVREIRKDSDLDLQVVGAYPSTSRPLVESIRQPAELCSRNGLDNAFVANALSGELRNAFEGAAP